jgi:hypothetical protein
MRVASGGALRDLGAPVLQRHIGQPDDEPDRAGVANVHLDAPAILKRRCESPDALRRSVNDVAIELEEASRQRPPRDGRGAAPRDGEHLRIHGGGGEDGGESDSE